MLYLFVDLGADIAYVFNSKKEREKLEKHFTKAGWDEFAVYDIETTNIKTADEVFLEIMKEGN